MMGVYIKGMEMPTSCRACLYSRTDIRNVDWCVLTEKDLPCECPIIPVPPHGRLIDADALDGIMVEQSGEEYNHHHAPRTWERALSCFRDYIKDAPTIIPAEPPKDEAPTGPYDLLYEEGGPDA